MQAESRVVDQPVDGAGRVLDAVGDAHHVVADGEVGGDRLDLDAVGLAQLGGDLLQAVGVAGHEDQIGAAAGEFDRERMTDAGRPTRDQS